MTIRIGRNPVAGGLYIGKQSSIITDTTKTASGTIALSLVLSGGTTRRVFASGNVALPSLSLIPVPIHIVRRRGSGTISTGAPTLLGAGTKIGHINGSGTLVLRPSLAGTALVRRHASGTLTLSWSLNGGAQIAGSINKSAFGTITFHPVLSGTAAVHRYVPAHGDLALAIALSGTAARHARVTATGEISLGPLSLRSGELGDTAQVIPIEGTFVDPVLEGTFIDTHYLEGLA